MKFSSLILLIVFLWPQIGQTQLLPQLEKASWDTIQFEVKRKSAMPPAYQPGDRKNFSYLSIYENLDVSHIFTVCKDSKENIWLGGNFGEVVKYDGSSFDYFDFAPFSSKRVMKIEEGSDGVMWFGSYDGGLIKWDGIQAMRLKNSGGMDVAEIGVWDIFEGDDGIIWVCSLHHGLLGIKGDEISIYSSQQGLSNNQVSCGSQAENGAIWMSCYRNGVLRLSNNEVTTYTESSGLPDNTVFAILPIGDWVLVGTKSGLAEIKADGQVLVLPGFEGKAIMDIELDEKSGCIWLATNGHGLYAVPFRNNEIDLTGLKSYSISDGLSQDRLIDVEADDDGNIWIGTYGNGLLKKCPDVFLCYSEESGLSNPKPWSLCLNEDQSVLLGLSGGGVNVFHDGHVVGFDEIPELASNDVHDIYLDHAGKFWFAASSQGVFSWNSATSKHYPFSDSLVSKQPIKDIAEFGGKMIFASFNGLLEIRDDQLVPFNFKHGSILNDLNEIFCLAPDKALLAGSGGIFLLEHNKTKNDFEYIQLNDQIGLGNLEVTCLYADEKWTLAGTKGAGILVYRTDQLIAAATSNKFQQLKIYRINESNGLSSNIVMALHKDKGGKYWFGVNNGISKLLQDDFKLEEDSIWKIQNFGLRSGLIDPSVTFNNVVEDDNGKIFWCTNSSLAVYCPENDRFDVTPPYVSIENIKLFFEDVDWNNDEMIHKESSYFESLLSNYIHYSEFSNWNFLPQNPVFSYDQNHLTFRFSVRDWFSNGTSDCKIKLEGLDKNWVSLKGQHSVTYSSIPPGTYTLKVQGFNSTGLSGEIVEYPFVVMPPFWKTKWFLASVAIFILVLLYLLYKWRVKALEKENLVLESKVAYRTEELRAEKDKSDNLLLNILPRQTAEELKQKGSAETKSYASASVLFSDFKGFSELAGNMDSKDLVMTLDRFFKSYDEAAGKYRIEKIKTIGDAYMCASGLPIETNSHAAELVAFALEMLHITHLTNHERIETHQKPWEIRIGIHTGPLIAGVVGKTKFAYDIWGDTVNIASRMESGGFAGRLNVSAATAKQISSYFELEPRGKFEVKGVGEVEMFFVNGFIGKYRSNLSPMLPNDSFRHENLSFR